MDARRSQAADDSSEPQAPVEDDSVGTLRPVPVRVGLLLGVPLALAGILVMSSVAFGATLIHSAQPPASHPAVLVGDANPVVGVPAVDSSAPDSSQAPAPAVPTMLPTTAPTATASVSDVVSLGALGAGDNLDGSVSFTWAAYTAEPFSGCILYYELTGSGKAPSLDSGSPSWAMLGTTKTSVAVSGIAPGDYQVRLQAVSTIGGVARVLAQTVVIHVHLSAGHPSST